MLPTFEQAIEIISALSPSDQKRVRDWIDKNLRETQVDKRSQIREDEEKFRKTLEWIDANREKYDGQFVLVENGELIAYGTDAMALYAEARAKGIKTPFVHRVKAKILPFGGW